MQRNAVISADSAEHYKWGGREGTDCDGWHLVKTESLSIIEERMPSNCSEARHLHARARQFFFVLQGELTLEIEGENFLLRAGHGIEVHPGQAHQAMNRGASSVRMFVTSQPPSHGDRTPA